MAADRCAMRDRCDLAMRRGRCVARAILRKSAPVIGNDQVVNLACFHHKDGVTPESRWSTALRIIGFQGENNVWLLTEGVPVCAATDKIQPCTPAESMAYLYLHTDGPVVDYVPGPDDEQQNCVDVSRDDLGGFKTLKPSDIAEKSHERRECPRI